MSISHFWSENYGHIYPVLKQLESEGMVTKEGHQTPGRPAKNVYKITQKGITELKGWLLKPAENHPMRFELMLKVFFAHDLPKANIIAKLREERESHARNLQTYQGIEDVLTTEEPQRSNPNLPYWLASLDFGKRFSTALMEWCDNTIRTFESR
jgi:DNA-binding PadR family transcriptional regulator